LSAFGLLPHHRKRPSRSKKMGYFTTIVNNYQQLINFFWTFKDFGNEQTAPQADLGNSP
jgi:hypothetical protein